MFLKFTNVLNAGGLSPAHMGKKEILHLFYPSSIYTYAQDYTEDVSFMSTNLPDNQHPFPEHASRKYQ